MPEPTRQYIFTERQIRTAFWTVTVGMVLALAVILLLITARPQGSYGRVDTERYQLSLAQATANLEGFRELGDGRVQLDIDHAIELVAQRGVANPFSTSAVADDEQLDTEERAEAVEDAPAPDGAQVYTACAGCHQANGQGIPGAFPPLSGHAADLYAADPAYLAQVVLFGLQGEITVAGATYNGAMPGFGGQLDDAEIAAVLDHVLTSWANAEQLPEDDPYTAEFVAEQREAGLSPQEVHARRGELDLE